MDISPGTTPEIPGGPVRPSHYACGTRLVPLHVQIRRRETDRQADFRLHSHAYLKQVEEEENFQEIKWNSKGNWGRLLNVIEQGETGWEDVRIFMKGKF